MNNTLNFLFTATLSIVALLQDKLALFIVFFSDELTRAVISFLTVIWLLMQITMNARKWFTKIKEFFKKGR